MLGTLQQRLIHAPAATPREQAAILFGTTGLTIGAMSSTVALTASGRSISSIAPGSTLQSVGVAMIVGAAVMLLRRIQAYRPANFRGRTRLSLLPLMALLLGVGLVSGIGANAQDVTYVVGDMLVTTDDLNLRNDASVDATLIETLPVGTPVTITSDPIASGDYTWYAVETDYGDGYVVSDYLADPETIPTGTSVAINTDELNLRTAAGTAGDVISVLDSGTEITIISEPTVLDGITWYQVDTAAGSGWVAGEFLSVV